MILITKDDNNRIRASEVPFFGTRKRPFSAILGAKNGTSDARNYERRPLFVANYPLKWWIQLLSGEFLQISKIAYFRLIFGRFPLIQTRNKKLWHSFSNQES